MQVKQEKIGKNRTLLEISVDANEVEQYLNKAYHKVVKKVSLPGFRKGKTPRHILEAHYGKEILYEDALDLLINETYHSALAEKTINPIDHPELKIDHKFEAGSTFKYKAEIDVLPEVELGQYKALKVKKDIPEVTEEQLNKQIDIIRMRHSEIVLADKEKLGKKDFAVIDFEGFIDGKPFSGGAAEGYLLEMGSHTLIPGFEERLLGMKPGEEKEIKVTMPAEERYKEMAGKEAIFKVKLHEIKQRKLPELDDEFAKDISEFSSWVEYKDDLRQKMLKAAQEAAEQKYIEAVVKKAVENTKIDIPEKMVIREADILYNDFAHNLEYQGIKPEDYLAYKKTDADTIKKELHPKAEANVKTELVLNAIARRENLQVTADDLKNKFRELSLIYRQPASEIEISMRKNRRIDWLENQILLEKTAFFLAENSIPTA
ncbi:MAG: trigger factor [Bacillota bacterium]